MPTITYLPAELRKALTDRTPLFAAAGVGDLALSELRQTPDRLAQLRTQVPARVAELRTQVPARVAELRTQIEPKTIASTVTERVSALQTEAVALPMRAAGVAIELGSKASDTYSELAVRGRTAVSRASEAPAASSSSVRRTQRTSGKPRSTAARKPATSRRRSTAKTATSTAAQS